MARPATEGRARHKARQERVDELRRKRREDGPLSALRRTFNKLTATVDPEAYSHISIVEDEDKKDNGQQKTLREFYLLRKKEEEEREKQQADVVANSILNYQTNFTLQVGICDIHITIGEKERDAFVRAQQYLKATKQEHMTWVEGDLSGKKSLHVHLWVKMGSGDGVVTAVKVQKAPPNRAHPSVAKARQDEAHQASLLLINHGRCDLELLCKLNKRTEGTAPAVDDIVYCARKADEANLVKKGYERLHPQLKVFGLGKGFLFVHRKTFKDHPEILEAAKYRLFRGNNWFTPRTALLLEKYALTEEEVVKLYEIFGRGDFEGNNAMDIYYFFSEMDQLETRYGHWLLEAVGAGASNTDITWDQYLEIVCFFGMFSRHEILRFVFGALDPTMRGYLDKDDFHKLLIAVTEHESGVPGNFTGNANRGFVRLARSGTQIEFKKFGQLCAQFPRLLHPIYQLQTAVQTHNLGQRFWDEKREAFAKGRQAIGFQNNT